MRATIMTSTTNTTPAGHVTDGEYVPPPEASTSAFQVEQHGIDYIPDTERRGKPRDLAWIWFGANIIFTYVIVGALVVGLGLTFWPAVIVAIIGNLAAVLVGVCAIPGPRVGTATLVVSRAAFGMKGNAPSALLSWLTAVGWEAVNIVIGSLSLYEIFKTTGLGEGAGMKVLALVLVVVMTFGVAVLGLATITVLNKVFSYLLGLGTIGLGIFILPQTQIHATPATEAASPVGTILLALAIVMAAPFSWVNVASDYSRYLPRTASGTRVASWTTLGCVVPAILICIIGISAATATDMSDPVAGLQHIVPGWFFTTYLAIIVGGTITNNFLNSYSSGMSLLAIGLPLKRWQAVLVDAVLGTSAAAYALFVFDFSESFTGFLSLMVVWIAPWCGIYTADLLLRRGKYDIHALHHRSGGTYWYSKGFNLIGLGWFATGILAAALFANSAIYTGPLTDFIGGGDLSIVVGFVIAFAGYYATARSRVARQTAQLS
jgi:NCS1 nucleoside transporter family